MLSDDDVEVLQYMADMYRSEFGADARWHEALQAIEKVRRLVPWLRAMEQLELRSSTIEVGHQ